MKRKDAVPASKADLDAGLGALQTTLEGEMGVLRDELKGDIGTLRTGLKSDIARLAMEVVETQGRLEGLRRRWRPRTTSAAS